MHLLVAGASGRTGRLLTALALERGHEVTALVRNPDAFDSPSDHPHVIKADVLVPQDLPAAFAGQDAVVSLLAPRPRRDGRVYVEGTRNLADAAALAGVRRFIAVSAEGAGVSGSALPLAYRLVTWIPVVARLYPDIARMDRELAARIDLDWTIVRAAILTNGSRTGNYRTAVGDTLEHGLRIPRADLAEFLLNIAESGEYCRQRVAIAR